MLAGLILLMNFAETRHKSTKCTGMQVIIRYPASDTLITIPEIRKQVQLVDDSLPYLRISDIDVESIEKSLQKHPYLRACDVLITVNGSLQIHAEQRFPVVRVINDKSENYFIDNEGFIIPHSISHPIRLTIANGNISDSFDFSGSRIYHIDSLDRQSSLPDVFKLITLLNEDDFLKSMISQVYINPKKEFELIPVAGEQLIMLGNTDNISVKFDKLLSFYMNIVPRKGWDKYKTINLEYENQVICSK